MERLNDIHEPKHLDVEHATLHPNGSTVHQYWAARQTLHVACATPTRTRLEKPAGAR